MYAERKGGPKLALNLDEKIDRTTFLLALCESDRKHATTKVGGRFTANLALAFADLNRNVDWISYATNDLPLIRDLPAIVKQAAIENKLNRSQMKALKNAYGKNEETTKKLLTEKKAKLVEASLVCAKRAFYTCPQLFYDTSHHRVPVPMSGLAKETHRRVPGRRLTF